MIEEFYKAFSKRKSEEMVSYYANNVEFSDPVFSKLTGSEGKNMWRMLCASAKDLKIEFQVVSETSERAEVNWQARYTFSKTGRPVHNIVSAQFKLREGKIISHHDHFNLWRWSQQALGLSGLILGWSPFFQNKIRNEAARSLEKYTNQTRV